MPSAKKPPRRLRTGPLDPVVARVVRRMMKETGTPGVAVGILHRGRAQAAGYGVTSLDAPSPVEPETLFQIGSTTKTFTASAVMRLVDKGRLDLDVPIRRYLRGLELRDETAMRRVTLRHVLTHMGGWVGDVFPETGRGDDALARAVENLRKVPQLTPLGEVWHYNNAGFYLAGRVLEKATGKPFEAAIDELLLQPLGMTRSFFFPEDAIIYRVAAGHMTKQTKHSVARPWSLNRSSAAAGGIISDVVDQLRWAQFHLGEGRAPGGARLLKASTMRQMQRVQFSAGSMAEAVGISWLLDQIDGERIVAHGGTTNGQLSAFAMVPGRDFAITVLTNSTRGGEVHRAILKRAFQHFLGLEREEPDRNQDGFDLRAYEGRYTDGLKTFVVDLRASGRRLRGSSQFLKMEAPLPPVLPFRLAIVSDDRAVFDGGRLDGGRIDFLRDARGRVRWARVGGRLLRRTAPTGK